MKTRNLAEEYLTKAKENAIYFKNGNFPNMPLYQGDDIKAAFNAGRESVFENIPELEWTETTYNLEDYLISHNNGWNYNIFFRGGAFKVCCNSNFIGQFISLTSAKQAANENYKEQIKGLFRQFIKKE